MKKQTFFKTMLLAVIMLLGSVGVGAQTWQVAELADLTASDIFLIVDVTSSKAMTYAKGASAAPDALAVTLNADKSQVTAGVTDELKWNIGGDATNGYTFYPNGSTTTWLYCTSTNNGVRVGTNAAKTFELSGNHLKHKETSRFLGVYTTNPDWRCYTSSTATNIKATVTKFFKYTAAAPTSVPTPKFSVATGKYAEPFKVGIAPYGADTVVRYTLDGTDPVAASTLYSDSINITATTTLKAIACTATDTSTVASATYTFPTEVANIAAFLAANSATNTTEYKIAGAVTVTYFNSKNLYVQDATGALLIYKDGGFTDTYTNGQTLTGVRGTYTLFNGLNEMVPTYMPAPVAGAAVEPAVKTINQITADNQNQYIKLEGVSFSTDAEYTAGTEGTNANFTDGTNTVAYYNGTLFLLNGSYLAEKTYNVVCIASVYKTTVQVLPISATEVISADPAVYVTGVTSNAIAFGEKVINGSYVETFTVSGVNLTGNIVLEMYDGAAGFSVSPASIAPVAGTVAETTVTVTYAPVAAGANADILNIASTGVTDIDIDLTGTGVLPTLAAPVAADATGISNTAFTANWNAAENATSYQVNVWTESENTTVGDGTEAKPYTVAEFITAQPSGTVYVRGYMVGVATSGSVYTTTPSGDTNFALADEIGADKTFIPVALPSGAIRNAWGLKTNGEKLNSYIVIAASAETYFSTLGLKSPTSITLSSPFTAVPVVGSPFTTANTSLEITGLTKATTYNYSVVAMAVGYNNSVAGNTVSVTTSDTPTGLCRPTTIDGVSFDGAILRNAAKVALQVYNSVGQMVISTQNADINLSGFASGVYVVKSVDATLKIVK